MQDKRRKNQADNNRYNAKQQFVRDTQYGKVPPCDIQAEEALLGCLLSEPDSYFKIPAMSPEDFYRDSHIALFDVIQGMHALGDHVDIFTVFNTLKSAGTAEMVGGAQYLAELSGKVSATYHVASYAGIVLEMAKKRRLIVFGNDIMTKGYDPGLSSDQILREANLSLSDVDVTDIDNRTQDHGDILVQVLKDYEEAIRVRDQKKGVTGVTTGSRKMDNATGGWQRDDFILIGGRPGMFKTGVISHFIRAAATAGTFVDVYNLEMTNESYVQRLLSAESGIPYSDMKKGVGGMEEIKQVNEAISRTNNLPIAYTNLPGIELSDLCMRIRKTARTRKTGLIAIDYIQLITVDGVYDDTTRVSKVSSALRSLILELKIPIVAAAQLSRQTEGRTSRRPMLADLRNSGQLEQDATLIMGLYRPDYYEVEEARQRGVRDEDIVRKHSIEFWVLKQRAGQTGLIEHWCDVTTNRIWDEEPVVYREGHRFIFNQHRPEFPSDKKGFGTPNMFESQRTSLSSQSPGDVPF